jgi:hypothetical protein
MSIAQTNSRGADLFLLSFDGRVRASQTHSQMGMSEMTARGTDLKRNHHPVVGAFLNQVVSLGQQFGA